MEMGVNAGLGSWDNQKIDLVSGEGGKASQLTKSRPKSLNLTPHPPLVLDLLLIQPIFGSPPTGDLSPPDRSQIQLHQE